MKGVTITTHSTSVKYSVKFITDIFDNLTGTCAHCFWHISKWFPLVLIWELEPYIASTMLMSDKDVAIIKRVNIHLSLLFLNYEVVSWSVWKKVCSQPLWLNKLQFKCARQKQAADVVPCKCRFLWFKVNNCHLKTLRCDSFPIFHCFLVMVIVFASTIKPPVMPLYSLKGWCMRVKSFWPHFDRQM